LNDHFTVAGDPDRSACSIRLRSSASSIVVGAGYSVA